MLIYVDILDYSKWPFLIATRNLNLQHDYCKSMTGYSQAEEKCIHSHSFMQHLGIKRNGWLFKKIS